jgi:hypothetical protein
MDGWMGGWTDDSDLHSHASEIRTDKEKWKRNSPRRTPAGPLQCSFLSHYDYSTALTPCTPMACTCRISME